MSKKLIRPEVFASLRQALSYSDIIQSKRAINAHIMNYQRTAQRIPSKAKKYNYGVQILRRAKEALFE